MYIPLAFEHYYFKTQVTQYLEEKLKEGAEREQYNFKMIMIT
jgi:hypothetical protein